MSSVYWENELLIVNILQKGNKDCGYLGVRGDRDSFLEDSGLNCDS